MFVFILRQIGTVLSFLGIAKVADIFESVRDHIYTGYLSREFAQFGDSVIQWHVLTLKGEKYIRIGNNSVIAKGVQLTAAEAGYKPPHIYIGDHCLIRAHAHITAINEIYIGDNVLTGTNVLITDNAHGTSTLAAMQTAPSARLLHSNGAVRIEDNVWLGNNVCVMPGVTVGQGTIIGANSVVTHDIPPYSVAAGIPAKVLKQLNINQ